MFNLLRSRGVLHKSWLRFVFCACVNEEPHTHPCIQVCLIVKMSVYEYNSGRLWAYFIWNSKCASSGRLREFPEIWTSAIYASNYVQLFQSFLKKISLQRCNHFCGVSSGRRACTEGAQPYNNQVHTLHDTVYMKVYHTPLQPDWVLFG